MTPYFTAPGVEVYCGDCLDVLPTLEAQSVDASVCEFLDSRAIPFLCGNYDKDKLGY